MGHRFGMALWGVIVGVVGAPLLAPSGHVEAETIGCVAPSGSPLASVGGGFYGLAAPRRVADTRTSAAIPAGCWLRVDVPASVPLDAEAVVINLTADAAPEAGFLTAHSCDTTLGSTSTLNVHVAAPTSRLAIVPIGSGRELCVYSARQSHAIVDVFGWFGPGGAPLHQMAALRSLDTRSPVLRPPEIEGIVEPGERVSLDRRALGIPAGATGVVVNLTATQPAGPGYLSAFPCASGLPPTSNINYSVGISRAGLLMLALDRTDSLCLELGRSAAHVIVDVVAWFGGSVGADDSLSYDLGSTRVADTRHDLGAWAGPFAAGETRELDAIGDMPLGTEVAVLGITATRAGADGFVQVRPCGETTWSSSLNYVAGRDISNLVTVPVAGDGTVCITASAPTDLVIDVFGGFGRGELIQSFEVGPFEVFPDFDRDVTDYVAYCTDENDNAFDVAVQAAPGTTVTIVGHGTGTPGVNVTPTIAADDAIVVSVSSPTGLEVEYWVRCLPSDFPHVSTSRVSPTSPGWYLVGNANFPRPPGEFAMILDSNGVPVWYRRAPNDTGSLRLALDIKRWSDGSIAWVVAPPTPWGLDPTVAYERFTLDGVRVATHRTVENPDDPGSPRPTDHHELVEMPNGNVLLLSYPSRTTDGGTTYDCIADDGSELETDVVLDTVIQEVDPVSGALVKEWSTDVFGLLGDPKIDIGSGGSDHGEVLVPRCFGPFGAIDYYDPVHANALSTSADGSRVLLSARHLDAVYAINWATGDIDWKLGGSLTPDSLSIVGDPHSGPRRQHDVRLLPNGHVSMFDNQTTLAGAIEPPTAPARYLEFSVDETARTATLVRSIERPNGSGSGGMGSARLQPDGEVVIGWGAVPGPTFTEFDAAGDVAFDVSLGGVFSYRAIKEPAQAFDLAELRATAGG